MSYKNDSAAPTINEQPNTNKQLEFVFKTNEQSIHIEMYADEPIFLAKDVCDILELENVTKALYVLDDDQKLTLPVVRAGQSREMNFVTESGLYALIFQSRKPEAKKFQKWVTTEVLPTIRKTGSYGSMPQQNTFEYLLSQVKTIIDEQGTWYAASMLCRVSGKGLSGNFKRKAELLQVQGLAKKVTEGKNNHWYVHSSGVADILGTKQKPTQIIANTITALIQKGGSHG